MKINLWSMFLSCLMGQAMLSLFGFQTPKESFVALCWQDSAFFLVWLTQRAAFNAQLTHGGEAVDENSESGGG
jgi:hypothetical protein